MYIRQGLPQVGVLAIPIHYFNKNDMDIKQLVKIIMIQAEEKGFGTSPEEVNIVEKIVLIHSEVSEAYEAYRHKNIKNKDGFEEELGDIIIRTLHLCGALGIDIEQVILKKIEYNKGRAWDWDNINETHKN